MPSRDLDPRSRDAEGVQREAPAPLIVAVDIGGTFTDVTLQDAVTGEAWTAKTPSTPRDPSEAFVTGVRLALDAAGRRAEETGRVLHGTTVATNLILEGRTAPTALLTTAGFRHVLEIGRADLPRRDNLWAWVKPRRPVPPSLVFEAGGRMAADGSELAPLDEAAVRAAARAAKLAGVAAIAVCFLHAFANPNHERRALAILAEEAPGLALTASVDVFPVVREYERSMATVLNAAVMPAVSTYIARLETRLEQAGIAAPLLLMKSNGGVAGAAAIRRAPAQTALSGPAAGVVGARAVAAAAGVGNLITVDIGGTSADICLIAKGEIGLTQTGRVGPWPLPLPMVDMVTIGAGGGSLARIGADGTLTVGPQSAGAEPGPACYGRGGTEATVTDAHMVLGHLPPSLLGGRMALDPAQAAAAVARVAEPLGLTLDAAARGILAIADNNMVGAIRVVSVERGHDPRDFTLVPFGGAGPLHGCALAELLGITRVLVPPAPGVLCAQGLLAADLKAEFTRSVAEPLEGADLARIEAAFAALESEAAAWFAQEQVAETDRRTRRVALMRYEEQGHELAIPWTAPGALGAAFAAAHRGLYGFDLPEVAVEIVTLRVEAAGSLPAPAPTPPHGGSAALAEVGRQRILLKDGAAEAPVLDRARLGPGAAFAGPAIVTQLDATTVVGAGWSASVHPSGALLLTRA
ncbi:hydantoinase/oxoprolinase family protein [Roseomonas eburnea]|uniref:Hydantoinase/oxoprolinase family protein n=1 Tax=Neoroseomonas eburnea TaxID=1346889 RepID=A0A9X9X6C8_9PROT|nr:hydantoinase/oxoprolinase family protein [Neoroseomonas eburnea]MBR0679264.1 hydantoinase/oxoprolinase family protein [Neoroseomonas eburnea]